MATRNGQRDTLFAAAEAAAPIKLQTMVDEDSESIQRVKLVQIYEDGTTLKREVPCFDGSSAELLFYTMEEFDDAVIEYEWTDNERFVNYRKTLKQPARNTWDTIVRANGAARTNVAFALCRTRMIRRYVAATAYDDEIRYLESCRKPMKMDCRTLAARLQAVNLHLPRLPSLTQANPQALTDAQLARLFFTMMPAPFQTTFRQSSLARQPESYSLIELSEYMTQLAALEPSRRLRGGSDQRDRNTNGGRRYNGSYRNRDYRGGRTTNDNRNTQGGRGRGGRNPTHGGRGRGGRYQRNRDQRNDGQRRLDGNQRCPIHLQGSHKWSECSLNPESTNYGNPQYQRRGGAQQNAQNQHATAGAAYHAHQQQLAPPAYPALPQIAHQQAAAVPPGQNYAAVPPYAPPAITYGGPLPPPPR